MSFDKKSVRAELDDALKQFQQPAVKAEQYDDYQPLSEAERKEMREEFSFGVPKGTTTYFDAINPHWTWRKGETNVWTGYAGEGKTTMMHELCLCKAIGEGQKFAMFSPENMPKKLLFNELIETYTGKSTDRTASNYMTMEEYDEALNFIEQHFFPVYPDKTDFRIDRLEDNFRRLKDKFDIYGAILDPYVKIKHEMGGQLDHHYLAQFMMQRVAFSRELDISYHVVAHQVTATKKPDSSGNYNRPTMYTVKGGGTFADSTDNLILIYRPNKGSDFTCPMADFISEKIKRQKLTGTPATVPLMFDRYTSRFYQVNPHWEQQQKAINPEFDWRAEPPSIRLMNGNSYSPLAVLKGEVSKPTENQHKMIPHMRMYGAPQGDGTAGFESMRVNVDDTAGKYYVPDPDKDDDDARVF